MFCTNCGKEINDNAAICPYCGVVANKNALSNASSNTNQSNTMAIVGFIFSFFFALVGLICSIIGFKRAPEFGGNGKGLALAGIIISSISIIITIIVFVVVICGALAFAGSMA